MAAPIIVVSGPSGAGKTTVATLVAAAADPSVLLRMDDVAAFVVHGWVDPWLPEAEHQHQVLGGVVAGAAMTFAAGGWTVVLDGHIFPEAIARLGAACAGKDVPLHHAVLFTDLATCVARVDGRVADDPPSRQQVRFAALAPEERRALLTQQHERFAGSRPSEGSIIDASGTEEVAAAVLAAFTQGRLRVPA